MCPLADKAVTNPIFLAGRHADALVTCGDRGPDDTSVTFPSLPLSKDDQCDSLLYLKLLLPKTGSKVRNVVSLAGRRHRAMGGGWEDRRSRPGPASPFAFAGLTAEAGDRLEPTKG